MTLDGAKRRRARRVAAEPRSQNILYLSYDGALDPLGRSQVVPYLEGLARAGYRFDLISFEKRQRFAQVEDRRRMQARLAAAQITWHPLRYHKRPSALATAYDLGRGLRLARRLERDRHFALVHARSYPASLIAWRLGLPYIFDMRGRYPEERVEGGIWPPGGVLYRIAKGLETRFLRDAAAVITLTEASVSGLRELMARAGSQAALEVIPTGVDLDRFQALARGAGPFTAAYIGSLGTWYLIDEMLLFGRALLACAPAARLLFLTNDDPEPIRARAAALGLPAELVQFRSVPHEQVPAALSETSATFALIRPTSSKIASAATKFGESLALGLPALTNRGIGDSAEIALRERVGVVVEELSPHGYARAAQELLRLASEEGIRERCRRAAETHFDLARGVARYAAIYQEISGRIRGGRQRRFPRRSMLWSGLLALLLALAPAVAVVASTPLRDYLYRELSYMLLTDRLAGGERDAEMLALRLNEFVAENVYPGGGPVLDTNSWDDLIRGIGWCDQDALILATLLATRDVPGRLLFLQAAGGAPQHTVAEVYLDDDWRVLDPMYGLSFSRSGKLATYADLTRDPSLVFAHPTVNALPPAQRAKAAGLFLELYSNSDQPRHSSSLLVAKYGTRSRRMVRQALRGYLSAFGTWGANRYQDLHLALVPERLVAYDTKTETASHPELRTEQEDPALFLYYRARNYHLYGRAEQAERLYREILEHHPSSAFAAQTGYFLGLLQFRLRGDSAAALDTLSAFLRSYPRSAWVPLAHDLMGTIYEQGGDLPHAVEHYRAAGEDRWVHASWRLAQLQLGADGAPATSGPRP